MLVKHPEKQAKQINGWQMSLLDLNLMLFPFHILNDQEYEYYFLVSDANTVSVADIG